MPENWAAAVRLGEMRSPTLTLSTPNERWTLLVTVYANILADPREIELGMAERYDAIRTLLTQDYNASAYGMPAIRNVDLFGVEMDVGYQTIPEQRGTMYRVMEVTVPILVDDLAGFTA